MNNKESYLTGNENETEMYVNKLKNFEFNEMRLENNKYKIK